MHTCFWKIVINRADSQLIAMSNNVNLVGKLETKMPKHDSQNRLKLSMPEGDYD